MANYRKQEINGKTGPLLIPGKSLQKKRTFSSFLVVGIRVEGSLPHLDHWFRMNKRRNKDAYSVETVLVKKPSRWSEGPSWGVGAAHILITFILIFFSSFASETWASTKRALLIGINDYRLSGMKSLQGPGNDLRLIKKVLQDKFQFQEENIITLIDKKATHTGLEKAFSRLARKVKKGDFIYIHYCGHGSQVPDKDGDEYPCFFDQTWVPYGSRSTRLEGKDRYDITDDELHLWLIPIFNKTEHVVFVSDSCHSGSVTRGDVLIARSVPADLREYPFSSRSFRKNDFMGGILIGAAQDAELAFEASFNGKIHGLFSWYWANALKQARPGDRWGDLFKRAGIMVSNYFDRQHPQFQGDPDKPVFGKNIKKGAAPVHHKKRRPRIPISRVSSNRKKIRIEAGSLSGVSVGSTYRLYNPGVKNGYRLPSIKITRVKPFYSVAAAKGTFKVGDLVIEESPSHPFEMVKNPGSHRSLDVDLAITLWLPAAKPEQNGEDYLELPGNSGRFKKQGVFSPVEMEKREVFPQGSLLAFKIKNNSRADYYIYLLDIMDNGRIEVIFPAPGDRRQRALLPAGRELDLKNIVLLLLDRPGREIIRLITAEAPVTIGLWAQGSSRGLRKRWGTIQFSITIGGRR